MSDIIELLRSALAGRYEVEREIGHGGMAVVFLARDMRLDRRVAIKVLRPELSASLGGERFLREIRFAATLQHPHILAVHESGEAAGLLYYVMPFVEGESLRARLDREGALEVDDALRITREVAGALHHAHERDIVHRDIKPANILLSGGHAVVADFGIARAINAAGGMELTEIGLAVGTPAYMSPEQASGERRIDARADVYAMGCLLYEMLAGEPPFRGSSTQRVLAQHAAAAPPSIRAVRPTVPDFVDAALATALAKEPADRFPTARAFADALPFASTSEARVRPFRSRVPPRVAVPALAALALVLAGAAYGVRRIRAADVPERISVAVAPVRSIDSADAVLADGLTLEITTALTRVDRIAPRSYVTVALEAEKHANPLALGRSLGVDYVLASTLRRSGNRLRMTSELIHVADGTNAWAGRAFEGEEVDLFQMQDSITTQLVRELAGNLGPRGTMVASTGRGRRNPEAYRLYLEGRQANLISPVGSRRAVELLTRAVELDSTFADAWAALAGALANWGQYTSEAPANLTRRRVEALNRALALDSLNGAAWRERASLTEHLDWNFEGARREYERAIRLAPSDALAHDLYAQFLWMIFPRLGDSATAVLNRAIALDPTNSHFAMIRGWFFLSRGQLARADSALSRALQLDQNNWVAYYMRANIELKRGRTAEAIRAQERSLAIIGPDVPFGIASTALVYGKAGEHAKAGQMLDRLTAQARTGYVEQAWFAMARLGVGDRVGALDALEASGNARELDFVLALSIVFAELPRDPRVIRLLRRTGLERHWLPQPS